VGAIALEDGLAFIDESLCNKCEACLTVCEAGAILAVEAVEPSQVAMIKPEPLPVKATQAQLSTPPTSLRELVQPALGTVALWTGRELLPRLVDLVLERLSRPGRPVESTMRPVSQRNIQSAGLGLGRRGRRRWRRRRQRIRNNR
jgi:ferredoxin